MVVRPTRVSTIGGIGLALCAACSSPGPAGIHVVVTIDPSVASGAYFDHVTVVARGASESAVACFFPPDAPARQAAPIDAGGHDPCVDLLVEGALTPPTSETWDLAGAPRTVNFVFPEGSISTIHAYASLGEGAPVAVADLTAPGASIEFPEAVVTLTTATQGPASCMLAFAPEGVESSSRVCDAPPVSDCLASTWRAARSATVDCLTGDARFVPPTGIGGGPGCGDEPMVWHGQAQMPSSEGCAPIVVIGRFVRCASDSPVDGDADACPLTADCTPPPTIVGYESADRPEQAMDISCMGPSLVPRALVAFFVNERRNDHSWAYPFLAQRPPPSDDADHACFFDVQSIFVASSAQIACPGDNDAGGGAADAGGDDVGAAPDTGPPDPDPPDAWPPHEAGAHDGGPHDAAAPRDGGSPDGSAHDAGPVDASVHDTGPPDAQPRDSAGQ